MYVKIYNKSIIPNLPPEREADITLSFLGYFLLLPFSQKSLTYVSKLKILLLLYAY